MSSSPVRFPPALSFTENKELRELFGCVVDGTRQAPEITLVCGAGVSMDAGLPDWTTLVERVLSEVDDDFREWLVDDPIDISRKVSVAKALLPKHMNNHEVLRRSLYADVTDEALPGILGRAIARFAATPVATGRRGHPAIRVATLNFDDLLEIALRDETKADWKPRPLSEVEAWLKEKPPSSVLHLHGTVPSDGGLIVEPVVLGEADFVIHGAAVRDALVDILTSSHTIFVGLSMTDPNVVSALLDPRVRGEERFRRFVIVSPETSPLDPPRPDLHIIDGVENNRTSSTKRRPYEQYLRLRGQATAKYLKVTPIFLNSIAQNSQLFLELTLARQHPVEYMADDSTIRYGRRLLPLIRRLHEATGLCDDEGAPTWDVDKHRQTSEALSDMLDVVVEELRSTARTLDYSEALGTALQLQLQQIERFALFLWIRALPDGLGNPEYSLQLAGTSAYVHRDATTGVLTSQVSAKSGFPAADAVYYGNWRIVRLHYNDGVRPLWKTMFAVPISMTVEGVDLNCGAITLNSTLPWHPDEPGSSILGYLSLSQQDALAATLMQVAVDVPPWLPGQAVPT